MCEGPSGIKLKFICDYYATNIRHPSPSPNQGEK